MTPDQDSKILITVFSKTGENYGVGTVTQGNTMLMAQTIQKLIPKATIFEIEPVTKYPDGYDAAVNLATKEFKENAKPKIKHQVANFSAYDVIFIGYPIWWSKYPRIVSMFLESYDFAGKIVVPFCTHEGSGESGTFNTLQQDLPKAKVLKGLSLYGHKARQAESADSIKAWLTSLGFIKA